MTSTEFKRYIKLLGFKPKEPNLDDLTKIISSHLKIIPFENISKLYYFQQTGQKRIPALSQFLYGSEKYHFGGTCYVCNYHLYQLLKYLGYDVKLCGADMSQPDVHIVILVKLDGREYIVDVGYAAPFLEPIPRDLLIDYKISRGKDDYILHPMDNWANRHKHFP